MRVIPPTQDSTMLLLRRFAIATLVALAIGILFIGCAPKDTTTGMEQSVSIETADTMPEGYNRASQRERDLNIGTRFPKGERGSKDRDQRMAIENRVGADFDEPGDDDTVDMLPADVNRDYTVSILDLLGVISQYMTNCPDSPDDCPTDINNDNRTGVEDVMIVISSWGQSIEPPSPSDEEDSNDDDGGTIEISAQLISPDPVLLDSIYYDFYSRNEARAQLAIELDQGVATREWNHKNDVFVLPYAYGGGADYNADDEYTEEDLENFEAWLDANIPYDYNGPICLDMEGTWWPKFDQAGSQASMDLILDFYIEGLEYAQAMRPSAKFGYWGLPKKTHTTDSYNGPTVTRLLRASGALFPDVYENNPGGNDSARLQKHVERCLELVDGRVPVHVQLSPRYRDPDIGGYRNFHTIDEIVRDQARPALEAKWQTPDGTYRIASIGMWDAYIYIRNYHDDWWSLTLEEVAELWDEVDDYHNNVNASLYDVVSEYATPEEEPDSGNPGPGNDQQNKAASAG